MLRIDHHFVYFAFVIAATYTLLSGCTHSDTMLADGIWESCPRHTSGNGEDAQCTSTSVPLNWAEPEGKNIDLFVKRLPAISSERGQIWLLAGGPGAGGDSMENMADVIQFLDPGLSVYLLDHRGTRRSSMLTCPQFEDKWHIQMMNLSLEEAESCFLLMQQTWGEGIHFFNSTQAARDLGELITKFRTENEPVFILGGSYGTFWAMRYLQLFPDQATAVILDSLSTPLLADTSRYDFNTNNVGLMVLDLCANDSTCNGKLGFDPQSFATDVMNRFTLGTHCSSLHDQGIDSQMLKWMLASALMLESTRVDAMAILHRLSRCAPEDVEALACNASIWREYTIENFSMPLNIHMRFSEFWPQSISLEELQAQEDQLIFSSGASLAAGRIFQTHESILGRYPTAPQGNGLPVTDVPILILQGQLDASINIEHALAAVEHFTEKNQHVVLFPSAPHGAMLQTPTSSRLPCGAQIVDGFLNDPTAILKNQCLEDLQPVRFTTPLSYENPQDYSMERFGTVDLWEPGAVTCPRNY